MRYFIKYIILFVSLYATSVMAIREPRPTVVDSRIKVIVYSKNDVFKYTGYYGYQTIIEFEPGEQIGSISMGDTTSWQIVPSGHRLFIKPTEQDATTNMTIITDKRTYFFELYAENTPDIRDPKMAFNVKFLYPNDVNDVVTAAHRDLKTAKDKEQEEQGVDKITGDKKNTVKKIDLNSPENLNFLYSISGNEEVAPVKIFDDGEFTYLQFRDKNYEMPVILSVDENLRESIVNVKINPSYENTLVVEKVYNKLALRQGNKIVCIFNEAFRKY